ncbi:3-hydroxyacyl-CoA dehydrogenase family protein [Nocardioides sp.]|uniref:3-hydroxyacyl-CoA dehydrogenase family protein n=1 Tax=Nocardioides sp. TaxID=35761 RepID=UPI0039E6910A
MTWHLDVADVGERPVAVVGAGTLGRRIAMMFASRGGRVRVYDPSPSVVADAVDYARQHLPDVVAQRGFGAVGEVEASRSLSAVVEGAWLVVEAVPERLDTKIELFGELDRLAGSDAVLATNSSSYASRLVGERVRDQTRVCNMHFYMPPVANAVDLMSNGQTDRDLLDSLLRLLPAYGLFPFEARKESTGFIFNRVWAAIKRESIAVVADGVARPEDVDAMFKINWGMSRGPFETMDRVGLDVVLDIERHYAEENPHLPQNVRDLLRAYVDAGKLGVKTGEGWYRYDEAPDR